MRRAVIDQLMEARFPAAHMAVAGGDEAEERLQEDMRTSAAAERRRLEAMSDAELEEELEFAGPPLALSTATGDALAPLTRGVDRPAQKLPKGPKIGAAAEALRACYGDERPTGVSAKTMLVRVNEVLKAQGKDPVSAETLKRARRALWPSDPT